MSTGKAHVPCEDADDDRFRQEVRTFIEARLPPTLARKVRLGQHVTIEEQLAWQRILFERGWAALHWPVHHGGTGWSAMRKWIFEDECARAGAPNLHPQGLTIIGPILIAAGTEEQKMRYLPRILDGTDVWCQGFSEPGAGSDLAALACQAVKEGDVYIVNGSKIWTSNAAESHRCLLLARTTRSERKQQGITILLVDMKAPGVTVRPMPSIGGECTLNQVYFDNVKVPVADRVGEEDLGWSVLKANIGNERLLNANVGRSKAMLSRLDDILAAERSGGRPLAQDAGIRRQVARLKIELHALECTALRWMDDPTLAAKPETSLLKVRGTELQQRISDLMSEAVGYYGLPFNGDFVRGQDGATAVGPDYAGTLTPFYFFWRKASISAGTSEVMRNMIAAALFK